MSNANGPLGPVQEIRLQLLAGSDILDQLMELVTQQQGGTECLVTIDIRVNPHHSSRPSTSSEPCPAGSPSAPSDTGSLN